MVDPPPGSDSPSLSGLSVCPSTKCPEDAATAGRTSALLAIVTRDNCIIFLVASSQLFPQTPSLLSHQGIPAGVPGASTPTMLYLQTQEQLRKCCFTSSSLHILQDIPTTWRIYSRLLHVTSEAPHDFTPNSFCNLIFYFIPVQPLCSKHNILFPKCFVLFPPLS